MSRNHHLRPRARHGNRTKSSRRFLAVAAVLPLAASPALAASDTWDGSTDSSWATATNWFTDTSAPGAGETATFSLDATTVNNNTTIDLGAGITVGSILFDTSSAAAYTIGSGAVGSQILTLGSIGNAITMNSSVANDQLFNSNLALSTTGTYAFTNNSTTNALTLAGGISASSAGVKIAHFTGAGQTNVSGAVASGSGAVGLFKTGSGTVTFTGGGTFDGVGTNSEPTSAPMPVLLREGTTCFNGGAYSTTGEFVVGGVVTHGGAGTNTNFTMDAGSLTVGTWFSIGRGNGTGGVLSAAVLNNAATLTTVNLSMGYNGSNASNRPRTALTLNDTSQVTVTTNNNNFEIGTSAGSVSTITLNDSSTLTHNPNTAAITRIGAAGKGMIHVASPTATATFRAVQLGTSNSTPASNFYSSGVLINKGLMTVASTGGVGNFAIGNAVDSYGYFRNDNGSAATPTVSITEIGIGGSGGSGTNNAGVLDVISGAVNIGTWFTMSRGGANQSSQLNVLGGSFGLSPTANQNYLNWNGTNQYSVINVHGATATLVGTTNSNLNLNGTAGASNVGILTLSSGGKATVNSVSASQSNSTAIVNFNNGTMTAAANNVTLLNSAGLDHVFIHSGGATFDTNGNTVTANAALKAPTGDGLTSVSYSGATVYTGRPLVKITDTTGVGATAVADWDPATGLVTGVTITSPGSGYSSSPTITFFGGGVASFTTSATVGAVSSGGLTKIGNGLLNLTGSNTYTGGTTINSGTIGAGAANGTSSNLGTGSVTINSGGQLRVGYAVSSNTNITTSPNNITLAGGTIFADDALQKLSGTLNVTAPSILGSTYNAGSNSAAERDKGLHLDGIVSGSAALTIQHSRIHTGQSYDTSFVAFSNNSNDYSGTITVNENTASNEGGVYIGINGSTALQYATISIAPIPGSNKKFGSSPIVFKTGLGTATIGAISGSGEVVLTGYDQINHTYGADAIALTLGSNNASTAYSGVISGLGSLTKAGTGTMSLSGANTFAGNLTVDNGTLAAGLDIGNPGANSSQGSALGNIGTSFTRTVTVNNGAVLSLTTGNTLGTGGSSNTLAGVTLVVNQGGVFQTGLDGAGTGWWNKIGGVNLNGGTIRVGSGANTSNFQALAFIGTVTVAGSNASTIESLAASNSASNGIHLGQNSTAGQSITFDVADVTGNSNADLTISARLLNTSNNLTASGLTKSGPGTMLLTAANTYTGTTTVNGGKLLVNGTHSGAGDYQINAGTLGGSGTITLAATKTVIVNADGTVAPGISPGTLTLNGDMTVSGGTASTLEFEFVGTSGDPADETQGGVDFDLLNVTGTLSLGNARLNVIAPADGVKYHTPYTIVTAGNIIGAFGQLNNQVTSSGQYRLAYPNYNVTITDGATDSIQITFVPEPSTSCILLGGGLLLRRMRRR